MQLILKHLFIFGFILTYSLSFVFNLKNINRASLHHIVPFSISSYSSSSSVTLNFSSSKSTSTSTSESLAVPVYILIEAKITDLEKFADYAAIVPSIVQQYGGEYIVLQGKHTPLEGDWGYGNEFDFLSIISNYKLEESDDHGEEQGETISLQEVPVVETKIVIQKWPNEEMAKRFWYSSEYAQLKKLREGTGMFRIMLVEGTRSI